MQPWWPTLKHPRIPPWKQQNFSNFRSELVHPTPLTKQLLAELMGPMHPKHICATGRLVAPGTGHRSVQARVWEWGVYCWKSGLGPSAASTQRLAHMSLHNIVRQLWQVSTTQLSPLVTQFSVGALPLANWGYRSLQLQSWQATVAGSVHRPWYTSWSSKSHHHCEHRPACFPFPLALGVALASPAAALPWKSGSMMHPPASRPPPSLQSCQRHHAMHGKPQWVFAHIFLQEKHDKKWTGKQEKHDKKWTGKTWPKVRNLFNRSSIQLSNLNLSVDAYPTAEARFCTLLLQNGDHILTGIFVKGISCIFTTQKKTKKTNMNFTWRQRQRKLQSLASQPGLVCQHLVAMSQPTR